VDVAAHVQARADAPALAQQPLAADAGVEQVEVELGRGVGHEDIDVPRHRRAPRVLAARVLECVRGVAARGRLRRPVDRDVPAAVPDGRAAVL